MKRTLISLVLGATLALSQASRGALLFSEGFNYPSGGLGGNGSWLGGSTGLTVGNGNNLSYPGLTDLGGNALVSTAGTAGSMTINFSGSAITGGSVYYSFLAQ